MNQDPVFTQERIDVLNSIPKLASPEDHKELGYFYRNTDMLSCVGDIAIDMTQLVQPDPSIKPVLLFASG